LQIKLLDEIIMKEKSVSAVAEILSVSRQTIHKWLLRYKRYGDSGLIRRKRKTRFVASNKTSFSVEQIVISLAKKYWNDGVVTINDHLQYEHNISLHPVTIWRILKRNKIRYTSKQPRTRKKWKKKLYAHKTPGEELQMDTKYPRAPSLASQFTLYPFGYKQGKVIYTIIDDASRWVHARTYPTANKTNTLHFLNQVRSKAPYLIKKIRTDQGSEFKAKAVTKYLNDNNIEHRLNTPYCPEENGKIERFHRTLNEKCLRFGFNPNLAIEEMNYRLRLYLFHYNYKKKHRGLGMDGMTPFEKLCEKKSVNLTLQCYKT